MQPALARASTALENGDWQAARSAFEEALDDQETAQAYEGLSWAAWWLNDGDTTMHARGAAYRLYREADDNVAAARMAMWLAMDHGDFRGERAIANGWRERARRLLDGQPIAPEHGWMPILECWAPILVVEDPERLRRCAAEAERASQQSGDGDVVIVARAMEGLALVGEGQVGEGMSRLDEASAAALSGELRQDIWKLAVLCFLIDACQRIRDFGRAVQWCAQMREVADQMRLVSGQGICRAHMGALLVSSGDWADAELALAQAQSDFKASRPAWEPEAAVRLAELRRRQGRLKEAAELLRPVEWHPLAALGQARLALDADRLQDSADFTERYLRQVPQSNRLQRVPGLELLVRVHTRLGNEAPAAEAASELQAIADIVGTAPLLGAACLAKAVIAIAVGDLERGKACLEDAVANFERGGLPYEAALARAELAELLASLDRLERAREEADIASARLEKLGAATAAQTASTLARRLAKASNKPAGSELSRRQIEILRLIALGQTNKAIAAELYLSEKTVERHVSNIFNKLGVSSRAAATACAYEHELL
jgi:ATP/maltotriose-dependent transcriptional regulator MalT